MDSKSLLLVFYLLGDYAILLEHLLNLESEKIKTIFSDTHILLYTNKLDLVYRVLDMIEGGEK